ncbi:hypothetical protein [Micromonospora sp. NPDC049240]|uniref:hypothetical protein n=1 Tax=Micromonospora sp. NPDC049240 TaxID=3155151 RepID=UPI0033FD2E70
MDKVERRELGDLLNEIETSRLDEPGWNRVDDALTLIERSLNTGDDEWVLGRNELFNLLASGRSRARSGVRDVLAEPGDERESPADRGRGRVPQRTREHLVIVLHRIGYVPTQRQRGDESA